MQKVRVLESTGSWYKVLLHDGTVINARIPGKFRLSGKEETNPVAVGDWVDLSPVDDGTYQINTIHNRTNAVVRTATHGKKGKQIICANVDVACIVQSVKKPEYKLGLIDRFLAATYVYEESQPAIIINKADLADENDLELIQEWAPIYENLGIPVLVLSSESEKSINELKKFIGSKTVSFTGPSGVGKTTLMNALDSNLEHKTGEVSDWSNKGKHTTTFARLVPISNGGFIVDTPGIREFGIAEIDANELDLVFPDFNPHRENCKFYNCTHKHEPGCKVRDAVEQGAIYQSRYKSYLSMLNEVEEKEKRY
ncbi:ribosome small subunit-dependent GTPase A [bacterium]|nr:MAG: ribosome small subunit-dependent GTPase A [bacterium]